MIRTFFVNKIIIYISGIVLILLLIRFATSFSTFSETENSVNYPRFYSSKIAPLLAASKSTFINASQECLLHRFKKWKNPAHWSDIPSSVNNCTREIISSVPFLETTTLHPEHKFFMLPRLQYVNDPCAVVTFGIGGDISAEQHIQMTLPQCTFLGFDPNLGFKQIFVDVLGGVFVQAAASGKAGVHTIYKLENGEYKNVTDSKLSSAAKLIERYHGTSKLIDILNIDIEGFEFAIMDRLIHDAVYKNVCQINFELHPVQFVQTEYSYLDVVKVFEDVVKDGTFIWFKSLDHNQLFPSYFINVKNEFCIEKYLNGRLL